MSKESTSHSAELPKIERVQRFVTNDFSVRVSVVNATQLIAEAQKLHQSNPLAAVAIGRTMIGAILMAANLKPGQEVGIYIKGDGPLAAVYGEASYEGGARGFCPNAHFSLPNYDVGLKIGPAIGKGLLTVARHQPFQRQPHHGTVEIQTGEIGDDIAYYLHTSQQIRSIINLGVYLDTFGQVKAAGGFLIEIMPGVEDGIVDQVQKNFDEQKTMISELILAGASATELISPYLKGLPFTEIPHEPTLKYFCPCDSDRIKRALTLLSIEDLDDMIAKEEVAEIVCQMCGKKHNCTIEDLKIVRDEVHRNSLH
jgi:molecular chaperone Hsp33